MTMINWRKTDSVNLILIGVIIVGLLSGGIFSLFWTYPSDQGAIDSAVLQGGIRANPGNVTCCYQGGRATVDGPRTVSVKASSEARFIVEFNTTNVPVSSEDYFHSYPDGLTYVLGPHLWTIPTSTVSSFERRYVVFSYSFEGNNGGYPPTIFPAWFTGPQGNLTQTVHILQYGGTDYFHSAIFGTVIIEASTPGNYTLHYVNPGPVGSGSLNGTVVMGPSSVTFTKPYLYAGIIATLVGAIITVATSVILLRKLRPKAQTAITQPSYMRQ